MRTKNKTIEELDALIKAYKTCKDEKKRRLFHIKLVEQSMEFVRKIACGVSAQSGISCDDLIQVGSIGLIKAIELYNTDKNTKFKTYASYLVRGEMRHYLRDKVSIIKAPRELQELLNKITVAIEALKDAGINEPSEEEIADILKIPTKKIQDVMEIENCRTTVSLDQAFSSIGEDDITLIDKIPSGDYQEFLNSYENKIMLAQAIKKLPAEMQKIIELNYYKGLNQREIAEKIHISQMQVSRQLKRALSKLYHILKDKEEE